MRKITFYILVAFFALLLMGCGESGGDPNNPVDGELSQKFDEIINEFNNTIPYIITDDIELVDYYEKYNAFIEWDTGDSNVIDFTGDVKPNKTKAVGATISYNITIDDQSKSGEINVVVSPITVEEVVEKFSAQFSAIVSRNHDVEDTYFELFTVEWYSTNQDVFTDQGIYTKPAEDVPFQIKYVVRCNDYVTEEYILDIVAVGKSSLEKIDEVKHWLKTEGMQELYLTNDITLPTKYEPLDLDIVWESSNPNILSEEGVIKHFVFERYATLTAKVYFEDGSVGASSFECVISPLDTSKMSEKEILENFLSAIAVEYSDSIMFGGNAGGCNTTYGHLYFYVNENTEVIQNLCPTSNLNRPGRTNYVKFVVVHDTGTMTATATAKAISNNCKNNTTGYTSWHYTVGNDGVYQQIPDNEIAYHAGDGSSSAQLIKTNVKATWTKPNFSASEDGYMMINNIKSDFQLPRANTKLASDGPIWTIGSDGYYYIYKMWYSKDYAQIGTIGGNANSIGIESCVDFNSDYMQTCRTLAKLVAEIMIKYNLDMNAVIQHNTISGKDCPSGIRATNFWYDFKDIVSMEKFAKTYLSNYEFIWSGSGDIDDNGVIKIKTTATEVNYSVVVRKNGADYLAKSFTTKIN